MNVVQAAISQQVKRLEEEIGTELFERSVTEVRLTEAGRQMLQRCRILLAQAEQVHRVVKLVGAGEKGRLNFGFVDNAICGLLPPLVRAYRRLYPQVHVTFQTLDRNQQIDALVSHRLDLGLLPGPVLEPTLESPDIVFRPVVCSAPPYELAFAWRRGHSNRTVDLFRECTQRLVCEPS